MSRGYVTISEALFIFKSTSIALFFACERVSSVDRVKQGSDLNLSTESEINGFEKPIIILSLMDAPFHFGSSC